MSPSARQEKSAYVHDPLVTTQKCFLRWKISYECISRENYPTPMFNEKLHVCVSSRMYQDKMVQNLRDTYSLDGYGRGNIVIFFGALEMP